MASARIQAPRTPAFSCRRRLSCYIAASALAATACGGTTSSGTPYRGTDGGAAGSAEPGTGGRVSGETGGAPGSGGTLGVGGTVPIVGGSGGTVGTGGSGGVPAGCPLLQPTGACSPSGLQCPYDYFYGCLCDSADPYYCNPVPECWGTGGSSAGDMTGIGGIGAAAGEPAAAGASAAWVGPSLGGATSQDVELPAPDPCPAEGCGAMPAPTTVMCTCAGTWSCGMY